MQTTQEQLDAALDAALYGTPEDIAHHAARLRPRPEAVDPKAVVALMLERLAFGCEPDAQPSPDAVGDAMRIMALLDTPEEPSESAEGDELPTPSDDTEAVGSAVAAGWMPTLDREEGGWVVGDQPPELDDEPAAYFRGEHPEEYGSWQRFSSKHGTTGWLNSLTGERRYQETEPSDKGESHYQEKKQQKQKRQEERLNAEPKGEVAWHSKPEQVQGLLSAMLGEGASTEQLPKLVGALPGSTVRAAVYENSDSVNLEVAGPRYIQCSRSFKVGDDGALVCSNQMFFLKKKYRGGAGLQQFSNQVRALAEAGFDRIETCAGRASNMNGYYTWPRLGYDAKLQNWFKAELPKKAQRFFQRQGDSPEAAARKAEELSGADTVLDLMASEAGRDYWKKYGYMGSMSFDLSAGSRSLKTLNAYLEAKGQPAIEVPASPEREGAAQRRKEALSKWKEVAVKQQEAEREELAFRQEANSLFDRWSKEIGFEGFETKEFFRRATIRYNELMSRAEEESSARLRLPNLRRAYFDAFDTMLNQRHARRMSLPQADGIFQTVADLSGIDVNRIRDYAGGFASSGKDDVQGLEWSAHMAVQAIRSSDSRAKEPQQYAADWDESAHPRDHGKFSSKSGGKGGGNAHQRRKIRRAAKEYLENTTADDTPEPQQTPGWTDKAIAAVVEKARSWLTPAGLAAKAKAIGRGVAHPVETAQAAKVAAREKFGELKKKYGVSGATLIASGYVAYYTAAAMNPIMLSVPVPLTPTLLTTARLVRWIEKKARGITDEPTGAEQPVLNARDSSSLTADVALQEVNTLLAAIAAAHGERPPHVDHNLMRALLATMLEQSAGPKQYRGPQRYEADEADEADDLATLSESLRSRVEELSDNPALLSRADLLRFAEVLPDLSARDIATVRRVLRLGATPHKRAVADLVGDDTEPQRELEPVLLERVEEPERKTEPPVVVNVSIAMPPQEPPVVNVAASSAPPTVINIPEQPTPVVHVAAPVVNIPPALPQPAPVVHVAAPIINLPEQPTPVVNVEVKETKRTVEFERDQYGQIKGAKVVTKE